MSPRTVTMHDNPLTLTGQEMKMGDKAPDFTVLDTDLNEMKFSELKGKTAIISSVPSLDTPVCKRQTIRFNREAAELGDDVAVITVSMDLPFAQKRWAEENNVNDLKLVSDHRDADFGEKFGMLVKELRLLARAVFIVDKEGVIRYIQLVPEISQEPDYDAVMLALKEVLKS